MFLLFRPVRRSRKTKVIYRERKTFRRIIRDRHLTEEEMVTDEQIRSQVVQEFPRLIWLFHSFLASLIQ